MKKERSTGKALSVVLSLAALLLVARYAVAHFRREGAMTPIEAQAMDMSAMKPPIGTMPVAVYRARRAQVAARVTYTGSALPFNEETVYPRVTGRIVSLPVYPGMRVKAGDLVVRLDSAELGAKEQQAFYARNAAGHDSMIAADDIDKAAANKDQAGAELRRYQALSAEAAQNLSGARAANNEAQTAIAAARKGVEQARAEADAAREQKTEMSSSLLESRSALDDAKAEVEALRSQAAEAQAQIPQAQAEAVSAQADADYLKDKASRSAELYKQGALSQEEYQADDSAFRAAAAKLDKAKAGVTAANFGESAAEARIRQGQTRVGGATARLAAAQARLRSSDAAVRAADLQIGRMQLGVRGAQAKAVQIRAEAEASAARLQQAQAGESGAEAMTRGTSADLAKAGHETEHAGAMLGEAEAQYTEAAIVRGYTEIRATASGLVTQRMVSPGVLVNPGTGILKIAQVDPIRLQANVASEDLARLSRGMAVTARLGNGLSVRAHISAVFPAADPQSRTGIVEAVVPNPGGRIKPGQYVVLDFALPAASDTLRVPSEAIVMQSAGSTDAIAPRQFASVWVMERVKTGKPIYTCVMHPWIRRDKPGPCPICGMPLTPLESGGAYRARLVPVTTGADDGDYIQILGGLREGDEVITKGYEDLKNGDPVAPAATGDMFKGTVVVR